MGAIDMGNKVYFGYNMDVESFAEDRIPITPIRLSSTKYFGWESAMTETIKQPTTPILLKDLGNMYPTATSKTKYRYGIYLCQCGVEFRVLTASITSGHTRSCGCHNRQQTTTHGLTKHPLYGVWRNMVTRTTNQNNPSFKEYGGRGISVCDEWRNNPQAFFDWAYENGYTPDLSIDRIDNNMGYYPNNCRWTTRTVQARNTRKIMATNTSGYRGVSFHKDRKKWTAQIRINDKTKYLGCFSTALEAAATYDRFVIENNLEHTKNGV
jgi:hypothetical protein